MGGASAGGTAEDVLAVFERDGNGGIPLTTNEVAAALDCTRRTAYNKLDALAERELLETKKVGARGRVWWRPAITDGVGRATTPFSRGFSHPDYDLPTRVFDVSPIGIAIVDSNHGIVYANDRLTEILGRSHEEVTSRTHSDPDWEIYDEDGRPIGEDEHPVTRVFQTGEPVLGLRHGIKRPDGTERWLSSNSAPIVEEDGTVEGVVVGLEDVTELKEQETHLRAQRAELTRLNRVNYVVRGIANAVTSARTRADIENTVCELIAGSEPYMFAVLGHFSSSYTEFTPRASAGISANYLDSILADADAPPLDQGPGATAAKTREVTVVQNITELPYEHWQQTAERNRFRSFASIPLVHEGAVYGVLGVYARQPVAFDEEERTLLEELGEIIGHGLHAVEAREKLRNEQVVELALRSESLARPFVEYGVDAFEATGDGSVELEDGALLQYLSVKGMVPNDDVDILGQLGAEAVRLLSRTDDVFEFEVEIAPETFISRLATHDGELVAIELDDGELHLTVQLPYSANHEAAVTSFTSAYPDLELVSEALVFTPRTFRHLLETRLSDRQLTALELAYFAGYFDQPRQSTGEELAERIGVTATTFHRHLRNANERIFDELFDTDWQGGLNRE